MVLRESLRSYSVRAASVLASLAMCEAELFGNASVLVGDCVRLKVERYENWKVQSALSPPSSTVPIDGGHTNLEHRASGLLGQGQQAPPILL